MPSVVQFGAGAIGRGLLGQLWQEAGYETVFVDTDAALVDALNAQKSYSLRLVDNESEQTLTINNFHALHARDTQAVFEALRTCEFAAIAVGRSQVVPLIQSLLALGLKKRLKGQLQTPRFLPILLCENGLWDKESAKLTSMVHELGGRRYYFVSTIVDRMVPPPTPEQVIAEPFGKLSLSWARPDFPQLPHTEHVLDWRTWPSLLNRKLYLHNGAHALLAFHGLLQGHTFIWQALEDPAIRSELEQFWDEVTAALCQQHKQQRDVAYETSLFTRLQNRALGDTCIRVARDPKRKIGGKERLIKAGKMCLSQGICPEATSRAVAAALHHPDLRLFVSEFGIERALQQFSDLPPHHDLTKQILLAAEALLPASAVPY